MKFEIDLVRDFHRAFGRPVRQIPVDNIPKEETDLRQRLQREEVDELKVALATGDIVGVADGGGDAMYIAAGTCVQVGVEPTIHDFCDASAELLEDAQIVLNKGTHMHEWDQVRIGACMLEIVVRGMMACLGIPYEEAFRLIHENNMSKLGPDGKPIYREDGKILKPDTYVSVEPKLRELLISSGVIAAPSGVVIPAHGGEAVASAPQ